jgi:hypothetical protein
MFWYCCCQPQTPDIEHIGTVRGGKRPLSIVKNTDGELWLKKPMSPQERSVYIRLMTQPMPSYIPQFTLGDNDLYLSYDPEALTLRDIMCTGYTDRVLLADSIARAYKELHARHIYHIDIKPENVLIYPDSSIRLIDFDSSLAVDDNNKTSLFQPNWTMPYIDVTQIDHYIHRRRGHAWISLIDWRRWDVYVLGLLLLFVLHQNDYVIPDCNDKYNMHSVRKANLDTLIELARRVQNEVEGCHVCIDRLLSEEREILFKKSAR